jgi:hypothetical protein
MGTTYLHAVAVLDGNIADENDVRSMHDWYFAGDHPLVDDDHSDAHGGVPFRVSGASALARVHAAKSRKPRSRPRLKAA